MGKLEKALRKHFDETPQEELDKEWEELKHWNEIGPDAEEYINYYKNEM